ncbi:hypothetical protein HYALB_00012590 [Hymenoscyphus albidus]|uniref:Tail specific protease domain-containing protein n=1 Tax=Hymenoscyphus albidus TaxID=595503 RepID=A0A9N9LS38_9HELO|nr:hypothetical protein HYALB_00012590 [Hymenoscyphus albidus]
MLQLSLLPACVRVLFLGLVATSFTNAAPSPGKRSTRVTDSSCGILMDDMKVNGTTIFKAKAVYDCWVSVPFNPAVATRFLSYLHDTIQFQSTLNYLKDPPTGYQQPAVDLNAGLQTIQYKINSGTYKNEYGFEVAVQQLLFAAHDDHLDLVWGIFGAFSFGAPYDIVSVSRDGLELPKIYFLNDIIAYQKGETPFPSAISKINEINTVDYLRAFAKQNALGSLEPHSEFNQVMASPSLDIQGLSSIWTGDATFYPGESLTFTQEDGKQVGPEPWLAVYNGPGETGPLETGGDFYNFFVLGNYPASFRPFADYYDYSIPTVEQEVGDDEPTSSISSSPASTTATSEPTLTGWDHAAYPGAADVAQDNFGTYGGGSVSGYFIKKSSIAVLSIPTFSASGDDIDTFTDTISAFLKKSKTAGMKKVVIDLQQNYGGDILLAYDVFKQFFPLVDLYGGSRLRAHPPADIMGKSISTYFETLGPDDDDYISLFTNEWLSINRVNDNTNRNFTSWSEFFGPNQKSKDAFTTPQRYNLSSHLFNTLYVGSSNEEFSLHGFDKQSTSEAQPYAAKDIIILSDSLCSSTCAIFMEMMHHDAGVRTVVAGGLPINGPMQTPSLTRGARFYDIKDNLDQNINYAEALLKYFKKPGGNFLPNRTAALDVVVNSGSINLRDQIRKDGDIPVQFSYEAADCRIYFTPATVWNYTALWQYAADAIWTNPKLCVQGSTGHSNINNTKTAAPADTVLLTSNAAEIQAPEVQLGEAIMSVISSAPNLGEIGEAKSGADYSTTAIEDFLDKPCANFSKGCPKSSFWCLKSYLACNKAGKAVTTPSCVILCKPNNLGRDCPSKNCQAIKLDDTAASKTAVHNGSGYCVPKPPSCKKSSKKNISGADTPPAPP